MLISFLFSIFFLGKSYSQTEKYTVWLPQKVEGIEKLEYLINDEPQGTTAGVSCLELERGTKLNFLIKFDPQNYSKLKCEDVKIKSSITEDLDLNIYAYDESGNIITQSLPKDSFIDPNQTYVTSPKFVTESEVLTLSGVQKDIYQALITSDYAASNALEVKYKISNQEIFTANNSPENSSISVPNLHPGSYLKLWISPTAAFSNSNLEFYQNNQKLQPDPSDGSLTLIDIRSDLNIEVKGVAKNQYTVNFKPSDDVKFNLLNGLSQEDSITLYYGENCEFNLQTSADLTNKEVTANNIVLRPQNGVYTLSNVTQDTVVSLKNKTDSEYPISFEPLKEISASITDSQENEILNSTVKPNDSLSFKFSAGEAYTQNKYKILLYAVPTDILNSLPEDISSYLLTPTPEGIYTLNSVEAPLTIIPRDVEKNVYTVTISSDTQEASYGEVSAEKISENQFSVSHGDTLTFTLTSSPGYDASSAVVTSNDRNSVVTHSENVYSISNVTKDSYIVIESVDKIKHEISIDAPGFECTDENGNKISESLKLEHESETLKFRPILNKGYHLKESGIEVTLNSENAQLSAPDQDGFYTLSNVQADVTLNIQGAERNPVTVKFPNEEKIEIRNASQGNEILPTETQIPYGSNLEFEVRSTENENLENLIATSSDSSTVEKISDSPLVFSLNSVHNDAEISLTQASADVQDSNRTPDYLYLAKSVRLVSTDEELISAEFTEGDRSIDKKEFTFQPQLDIEKNVKLKYDIARFAFNVKIDYPTVVGNQPYYYEVYSDEACKNKVADYHSVNIDNQNKGEFSMSRTDYQVGESYTKTKTISNSNNDTVTIGYRYDKVYIRLSPTPAKKINVNFPDLAGIKFYEVYFSNNKWWRRNAPLSAGIRSYEESSETNAYPSVVFCYIPEEGYTLEGIELKGNPKITMKRLPGYTRAFVMDNCYTKDTIEIVVKGLGKRKFKANFSELSEGSSFSISSETFEYGGESTVISSNPLPGYGDVEEIKVFADDGKEFSTKVLPIEQGNNNPTIFEARNLVNISMTRGENNQLNFKFSNVKGNFELQVIRKKESYTVTFPKESGIRFREFENNKIFDKDSTQDSVGVPYGSSVSFSIETTDDSLDISNIQVTAVNTETNIRNNISRINNRYTISKITNNTKIEISGYVPSKKQVVFTPYEGLVFKNQSGEVISQPVDVNYGENISFSVELQNGFLNSKVTIQAEPASSGESIELPYNPNTKLYTIENITQNYRIYASGIELDSYPLSFTVSPDITFYNSYGTEALVSEDESQKNFIIKQVRRGESFSFKITPQDGKDISEIAVWYRLTNSNRTPVQIPLVNNVYTIENVTEPLTIFTSNIKSEQYSVEIRTTEGVNCVDTSGNTLPSSMKVNHGESISFSLALDSAYNHSTPVVSIKGSLNTLSPDSNGVYLLENITENKIIEVSNVTKNTYKVKFKAAEGVVYKTVKGKVFSEYLDVEYGGALKFVVSLMDAYDSSIPRVLLNGSDEISGSAGIYTVQNINDNMEISVENVVKNPEEKTMEDIISVPKNINSSSDVDKVVEATQAYNELSDEQKSLITNLSELTSAQESAKLVNHTSGEVTVTNLDWNIKLVVTSLNDDTQAISEMSNELERRTLLNLYEMKLYDLLTNEEFKVPYGKEVAVSMPCPDLTGYQNAAVVHKNSAGGIEYLNVNINSGTAHFNTSSFSRFGIAAKKIPNFSETPSDIKISVANLVDNEEELQSLLGEGLTSQLGELISTENPDVSDENSQDSSQDYASEDEPNDSFFDKIYKWAVSHELLAVLIILILGSLVIFLILLLNKKLRKQ